MTFQYFKLKYGFQPVLGAWQLDKLNLIFKREEMKISATEIILPSYLDIKWETVGWTSTKTQLLNYYVCFQATSSLL